MKRRTGALLLVASALVASALGVGCASSDTNASNPTPGTDDSDASGGDATRDALAAEDSAADAGSDADADVEVPTCSSEGWCYTTLPAKGSFDASAAPQNWGNTVFQMSAVWIAPDGQVIAVTQGGHVLRWDHAAWSVVAVTSSALRAVWGTSATDFYVGGDGGLLHATAAGAELTLTPMTLDGWGGVKTIFGTSATDVWVGTSDGIHHLEAAGAPDPSPAFVRMQIPNQFPDGSQFQLQAAWGRGSDVWIAGMDQTWCDPADCQSFNEMSFRKWKGGNDGETSWDRFGLRIPYGSVSRGMSTPDGVQIVVAQIVNAPGLVLRISDDETKIVPGISGIQHEGAYAWSADAVPNFNVIDGLWAGGRNDLWLAGEAGIRHFDGANWQIARLALVPGKPLLQSLHAIQGIVGTTDFWAVGDDVALHRTVTP
ncbi:hypothetical protein AKJ09_07782 [Labilithrix luteola]|uniref:Type IV fimbrial biogenesis protein PilY1 n=1 Tax=Labilithrix luteola TaxID=1391654 RepID=A0A0K1Q5W1_9BACT|nr:hypothetical protein [Labilithrix luteola]AKV01119.1 hypothetical protein AKJ09_07782 [Labilithrix luteola]